MFIISILFCIAYTSQAQALKATGGSGLYKDRIWWLNFSGVSLASGASVTKLFDFPVGEGVVHVTIDNISFSGGVFDGHTLPQVRLVGYNSYYPNAGLDQLYNIGGTETNNQLFNALCPNYDGGYGSSPQSSPPQPLTIKFNVTAYVTYPSGVVTPLSLIFSSAETDDDLGSTYGNEYTQCTTNGSTWRLLEGKVQTTTGIRKITFSNSNLTAKMMMGAYGTNNYGVPNPANVALLYTTKASATATNPLIVNSQFLCGGRSAIAIGFIVDQDGGDAPSSYGDAISTFQPILTGGNPSGTNVINYLSTGTYGGSPVISAGTLTTPLDLYIGNNPPDNDATIMHSANCKLDDTTGTDDEDAVLDTIQWFANQSSYSLPNISVHNATSTSAKLIGWVDFNNDGVFSATEAASTTVNVGQTTASLSWTGITKAPFGIRPMRLRITTDALTTSGAASTVNTGEVEDHLVKFTTLINVSAVDDINQTPEGKPVSGNLLTNDNNLTTVTSITISGTTYPVTASTPATQTIAGVGTIIVKSDGTYTFTPVAGYSGTVPTITYTATNANGGTDTANLYINVVKDFVSGTNNPPVANHDVATVQQGTSVTVKPLINDSDPDGDALTVTSISYNGTAISTSSASPTTILVGGVTAGTAYKDAAGNLIFTAAAGYTGEVPFTYAISDGKGGTANSTINITVTAASLPTIDTKDDAKTAPQGTNITGNVKDNDTWGGTNPAVTAGTVTIGGTTTNLTIGTPTTITGVGTITLNSNGTYVFDPVDNFVGTVPVVYTVTNTEGNTDKATLSLTSTPVVSAVDDINQTPEGKPVSGNLLTNDNNLTTVTSITISGTTYPVTASTPATQTITGVGTIIVKSEGTYTFTPVAGYSGTVPTITYTATNANGGTDTANLYINVVKDFVSGTNNPPVANHDVATVQQGTSVTVKPLTNDSDPDGDALSVTNISYNGTAISTSSASPTTILVGGVTAGTAYKDAAGNLIFTAAAGYTGEVPFTYAISDGKGGTANSTINITVTAASLPTIDTKDDAKTAPQGTNITGNVKDNDTWGGTNPAVTAGTVTIGGTTTNLTIGTPTTITGVGTITLNSNGTYVFDPVDNFVGTVPVVYTVTNTEGNTDSATLYLTSLAKVPDYTPILYINKTSFTLPSNNSDFVITIREINNAEFVNGKPVIAFRIMKDTKLNIQWNPTFKGLFGFDNVDNTQWSFSNASAIYYQWTYIGSTPFPAGGRLKIGINSTFNIVQGTTGSTMLQVLIPSTGVGGETNFTNNSDGEFIDFLYY